MMCMKNYHKACCIIYRQALFLCKNYETKHYVIINYSYDTASHLNMFEGVPYLYDDNGNLLQTDNLTNTWDAANRLIETTSNVTALQPIYDGFGCGDWFAGNYLHQ